MHSSFLSDQAELSSLLVLRDVSQEVKLEKSRRDFIANASHELKTPLFSLGGFLELLQDEDVDEKTKDEFVATMREQVDRLADLARKLLDLSQMDSGAIDVRTSRVELKEIVDMVAREFTAYSVSRDSRIDTQRAARRTWWPSAIRTGRRSWYASCLTTRLNILRAGAAIEVAGGHNGKTVSFTVADHGPGIPGDELPRVFERFYRGKGAGPRARHRPGPFHRSRTGPVDERHNRGGLLRQGHDFHRDPAGSGNDGAQEAVNTT